MMILAQKRLKEDKSTADGWVKKMITNISNEIITCTSGDIQHDSKHHLFPTSWPNYGS